MFNPTKYVALLWPSLCQQRLDVVRTPSRSDSGARHDLSVNCRVGLDPSCNGLHTNGTAYDTRPRSHQCLTWLHE